MSAPPSPSPQLPPVIAAFDDAQRRAIGMVADVVARLEAGMHARDIVELAETRLGDRGFTTWYHTPEVEIGGEIGRRGPLPRIGKGPKLEVGSLVSIDLGPANGDAYGDFGVTRVFGRADEPYIVEQARECTRAACGFLSRWKTCGEAVVVTAAWAVNMRLKLLNANAVGHRVLPREGVYSTGFPRSAHLATLLPRNRLHRLNPVRMDGMFALRPVVTDGTHSAAFEEMIYIHDDHKRILGRDSLAEVGTLP
ncbi:MAG: M24 family metallopeptidase [Myxococcales bacterium]|nr:M24 family metallopeptidase [Myxococcales bacterium]